MNVSEHMGNVIQKYLRGQYNTIDAYNEDVGEVAEPYRVLVVTGFPVKFSQEAATRLVEIATNGPRCGVFTLIMLDTEQQLPYDFNLDDLRRVCAVIEWDGKAFAWRDPDFENIPLQLDAPPPLSLLNTILEKVGHVMLGSQTLSGAYTPARATIGQMAIRIALQCEESDSRLILSDDNPAARLLSRAGEAIYNANNGLVGGNNTFQCAWLPEEELERYLRDIHTQ
jgi:hypothetical protein